MSGHHTFDSLSCCSLCPHNCRVNRVLGETGFCGQTSRIKVARASLHFWEEPCISGKNGSGAVFFSGCTLRCVFCQNSKISTENFGKELSEEHLCDIFLELQDQGAHNINLVTPTQFAPRIAEALSRAKSAGLIIPVVYNTGSYEHVETLKMFEGLVDIYLPDFKYYSPELSLRYSHADDYFSVASKAVKEMVRQAPEPVFDSSSMLRRGVIVRHLVLPGHTKDSKKILKYLYDTYGSHILISILNQYTPFGQLKDYPEINRKITKNEYNKVVDYAISLGIENGFIQEGNAAGSTFIPDFDLSGL